MIKFYPFNFILVFAAIFLLLFAASCKKDNNNTPTGPQPIAKLGLYELVSGDNTARRVYIYISKVGTQTGSWISVFDTGSSGMTIDAHGILPDSMITTDGFKFTGDSVTVRGLTITAQQATLSYGDANDETLEYGNLAYAQVVIGDKNGSVTTQRIPFFLYYKIIDLKTGKQQASHSNDVFGVGPGMSFANLAIASPLSYLTSSNTIRGFKLAKFNSGMFSTNGTFVSGLLTIGLFPDDVAASSGFIMHNLPFSDISGYSPTIPSTITYNGQTIRGAVLFDTGTPSVSTIENPNATANETALPANTKVTIVTNDGFTYTYTSSNTNFITQVAQPNFTLDTRTIFGIDFFLNNEYMMDYQAHSIGLKNN
jgi:hypothetical protein